MRKRRKKITEHKSEQAQLCLRLSEGLCFGFCSGLILI